MPGTFIAAFVTACLALPLLALAQTVSVEQAATETYIENLQLLSSSDSVSYGYVAEDTDLGNYSCGGISGAEATAASRVASRALNSINGYGSSEGLPKYMILCSQVLASGRGVGGIPVPPINLLMFDVSGSADHLQHLVLHEFYHLLEYRTGSFNDSEWQSRFGQGYKNSYDGSGNSSIGSGAAGFVNTYSESFPHEDRAELFAFLVLESQRLKRSTDSVVRDKAQYIVEKVNELRGWELDW